MECGVVMNHEKTTKAVFDRKKLEVRIQNVGRFCSAKRLNKRMSLLNSRFY